MDAKGATLDDLWKVEEGKAELVNGEIVRLPLSSGFKGRTVGNILMKLIEHERRMAHGYAFMSTVVYVVNLPHRQTISPDASFWLGELSTPDDFPVGAPVFAAEVRELSEHGPEVEARLAARRADYFAAGTLVVWDVDRRDHLVRVYRTSDWNTPSVYSQGEIAEAEPALPGWSMRVDDLFVDWNSSASGRP